MAEIQDLIDAGLLKAQAVLAQVGQTVTLRQLSTVLRDTNRPWEGTVDVPTDTEIKGAVSEYAIKDVDRGTLQEGDLQCLLLVLDLGAVVPTTADQVTWEGVAYAVNKAKPIHSGDAAVAYELRLRR